MRCLARRDICCATMANILDNSLDSSNADKQAAGSNTVAVEIGASALVFRVPQHRIVTIEMILVRRRYLQQGLVPMPVFWISCSTDAGCPDDGKLRLSPAHHAQPSVFRHVTVTR